MRHKIQTMLAVERRSQASGYYHARRYEKTQAARQDLSKNSDRRTSLKTQASRQVSSRTTGVKAQVSRQDASRRTSLKTQASRQEPSRKTSAKTQASRQDPSRKTSQDKRTRSKQDKMDYIMAAQRPSSTLNEPDSPVYGENVDYAIKIVQHFLNFLPAALNQNSADHRDSWQYSENVECAIKTVEYILNSFVSEGEDHFTPETQDKEIGLFNQPSEFVATLEVPDFPMDMALLGFPSLDPCQSPFDSDVSDSCPASPSPAPSPSPHCSSSSESGIEDGSDMEEANVSFSQQATGGINVKSENPPSTLNSLNQVPENGDGNRKRRKSIRKTSKDSTVLEELNKLLDETRMSVISTSTSQPLQAESNMTSFNLLAGIQTTAAPTSVSHSCPMSIEVSQAATLASTHPISVSSQLTSTVATKASSSPPVASQSKARSKPVRNSRKSDEPKIVIIEEPEENYRARYESEGCRGPIHGSQENTFPTVKVTGYNDAIWITVHLTTSGGVPHYHSIHGPGSTKVPCKETTLPGGVPAVQVMVGPDSNMTAVLDSLSIRRLRNWEGDRELRKRGIDPRTWKKERKEARLLFQAEIPEQNGCPASKLICKSKVFQCSSSGPPGNPEIWWASISEGSVEGGDELGLIGKKFQSGFKVRFFSAKSSEPWESFAEVDKSKSHQGAAVVLTPAYCDTQITSPVTVNVEVMFGNGRDAKSSDSIEFTYQPKPNPQVQEVEMHPNLPVPTDTYLPMDIFNSIGDIVMNSLPPQQVLEPPVTAPAPTPAPAPVPVVLPPVSDEQDWQSLCVLLGELHNKGQLSSQHVKELCDYIKRRDTLLLQAFRSARTASTTEQLQANFKQYLSGMLCDL